MTFDSLLDDFEVFIGEPFERDADLGLNVEYPQSPSFATWLWSHGDPRSAISIVWPAVMGGQMIDYERDGKTSTVFEVGLTMFLFDANTKKRLCLSTGESILEFVFRKQTDARDRWQTLGWCKDVCGEWEDVEYE